MIDRPQAAVFRSDLVEPIEGGVLSNSRRAGAAGRKSDDIRYTKVIHDFVFCYRALTPFLKSLI